MVTSVLTCVCFAVIVLLAGTVIWLARRLSGARRRIGILENECNRRQHLWNLLLDTLPQHLFAKAPDNEFRYVFGSASRCRFYGKPAGFFDGKNDFDFLPHDLATKRREEDLAFVKSDARMAVNTIESYDSDNKLHHLKILQFLCKDYDGRRLMLGLSFDVSDLVEATHQTEALNQKLKDSLDFFDSIINNMPCYVTAKDIDNDLAYIFCNRYFYEKMGFTAKDIIGKRDSDLFSNQPDYLQAAEWDREVIRLGKPIDRVLNFIRGDGEYCSLQAHWVPVRLMNGRNWLFIIGNEVTELNAARRDARQTAEWLRLTFNSIGDGVLTTDADGNIQMMNPVAERMMGVTSAEAVGKHHEKFFNIVSYLDERPMPSVVTRAIRTGSIIELANHTDLISMDGKRYHISDSAAPIKDATGKIVGAILVFHDVTEEYIQRDRLRDALFLLEFGAEHTHTATFRMKIGTREIVGSKLLTSLVPIRDGRLADAEAFVLPEDLPSFHHAFAQIVEHRISVNSWTYRSAFSGKVRHYRLAAAVNWDTPTEPYCYGVFQDITELVETAGKLKESQNLFQQVIHSIPVIIFAKKVDDNYRYVISNPQFATFTGRKIDDIIGHTDQEIFNTKLDDARWYRDCDNRIVAGGKAVTFIEEPKNAMGQRLHLRTTKIPMTGANGEKLLLGISEDITELTNVVSNAQIVAEVLKQVVVEADFSKSLGQIIGTLQKQLDPDHVILARYREDDKFHFYRDWHSSRVPDVPIEDYIAHEYVWNEHRTRVLANEFIHYSDITTEIPSLKKILAIHPDYPTRSLLGAPIFIQSKLWGVLLVSFAWKRPLASADEQLMRSMASIIALARIRDRQARAVQLADSERQTILDNIDIPIVLYNGHGQIIRVNQGVSKLTGKTTEELLNRPCRECFACSDAEYAKCPVTLAIQTGQAQIRDHVRPDLEYIVVTRPVFDANGQVANVVRSMVDVTELNNLIKNEQVMSACLESFLDATDMTQAINRVMGILAKRLGATRAYLCQFNLSRKRLSCLSEYVEEGRKPFFMTVQDRPYDTSPDWEQCFQTTEIITMPDTQRGAVRWGVGASWIKVRDALDARSYYANRILVNGKFWGYVGVLYEGRSYQLQPWGAKFFSSAAHVIELMLRHVGAQVQLHDALARAQAADAAKTVSLENEQTVNQCLETLFREDDLNVALNKVLEILTRHYHSDASYCLQLDFQHQTQWISHNYAADGKTDLTQVPSMSINDHSPWFVGFMRHERLTVRETSEETLRASSPEWIENVRKFGVRSFYAYPIFQGDQLWGDICIIYMSDAGKRLTDDDLLLLENASHMIEIILARQLAARQTIAALEKARAADKAKSFFIASVSHEIRTPLNAVIGFTELLKDASVSAETRQDYLDSISYAGNTLLQLINDVLDLSKLEADQMKIVTEPVEVSVICRDIMRVFEFRSKERDLELVTDIGEMPVLELDRLCIRQILFNLIGNAVKFTEHGKVKLHAAFARTGDEGTLEVTVTDNGIGIKPEDVSKLMEPFVQLPGIRGTNASNNGTGLGLAISRRLVEKMGGKLWIKSEFGKGSTFGMTLYHVRVSTRRPAGLAVPVAQLPAGAATGGLSTLRVLLVDDIRMNLKVMKALCLKAGVKEVETALSGKNALKVLGLQAFDIVLTDLWMPGMSGAELAEQIRHEPRLRSLPIIAVTADVEAKDNFSMINFSGVVQKPVTVDKLTDVFNKLR